MRQVRMYVDGYNFYYAIKRKYYLDRIEKGQENLIGLGWCDFRRLGQHMIDRAAEEIGEIKYFTALVDRDFRGHDGERGRQQDWLNAVSTITIRTIKGYLLPHHGTPMPTPLKPGRTEKHTDVNIAVEMLLDALKAKEDHKAILITGDTDLAPAVYAVQKRMVDERLIPSGRTVDVWLPPGSSARGWLGYFEEDEHCCHVRVQPITEAMLRESLLAYEHPLYTCPSRWRLPESYLRGNVPGRLRPDKPDSR